PLRAWTRWPSSAWSVPVRLTGRGKSAVALAVAVDPAGDAVVAWVGEADQVFAQQRLANGRWLPAAALGSSSEQSVSATYAANGRPAVAWAAGGSLDGAVGAGRHWAGKAVRQWRSGGSHSFALAGSGHGVALVVSRE